MRRTLIAVPLEYEVFTWRAARRDDEVLEFTGAAHARWFITRFDDDTHNDNVIRTCLRETTCTKDNCNCPSDNCARLFAEALASGAIQILAEPIRPIETAGEP